MCFKVARQAPDEGDAPAEILSQILSKGSQSRADEVTAMVPVQESNVPNPKAPRRAVKAALSHIMVPSRKREQARKERVEAEVCQVEEYNDLEKHSRTCMDDASRIDSYLARHELQGQYVDWFALRFTSML